MFMFFGFGACNLFAIQQKNAHNRETYVWMMDYAKEHFNEDTVLVYAGDGHHMGVFSYWFNDYPSVLQDEYWKDEYEAFAPQLMTRSEYEKQRGSLRDTGIWTVDIGNFWWWEEWDKEPWHKVERTEPFVFYDQTDEFQCDIAYFSGKLGE